LPPGFWLTFLGVASIILALILMTYIPQYREALSTLLGTGIALFATGLNELGKYYSSTTTLELREAMEPLGNRTVRLFVEAYNKGTVTIRDAKAILTVLAPPPDVLAKYLVKNCLDNKNPCPLASTCGESRPYLVSRDFPRIDGDLLPWSVPEKPIPRPVAAGTRYFSVKCTDFTHITSISPRQRVRVIVLDAVKVNEEKWIIKIFSEYGVKGPGNDPTPRFPRACLWLNNELELRLKVTVYGENLHNPEEVEIVVTKEKIKQSIAKYKE